MNGGAAAERVMIGLGPNGGVGWRPSPSAAPGVSSCAGAEHAASILEWMELDAAVGVERRRNVTG